MSKKKIVITGTAGLLGPHVARHFAEHGYHVVGIDRAERLSRFLQSEERQEEVVEPPAQVVP